MTDVDRRPSTALSDEALAALACPVCAEPLHATSDSLACEAGHAFDLARQGYVNLLGGGSTSDTGDSADMVTARSRFLSGSHYEPIAAAVVDALASSPSAGRPIADAGAGTGWLLSRVLDADSARCAGVALDLSKYAARRAAQAHPRILSVVADIWRPLPLASGVFDAVLNFFAPRNASEFARVLAPSGVVVAVTPLASHLCEVRTILPLLRIEPAKHERLAAVMADDFEMAVAHDVAFAMRLSHSDIADLVAMGPSSHHVDDAVIRESITGLPAELEVTGAVRISTFRKRNGS